MSKLEQFSQVKLETADSIREELRATNHPISMYKQAIKILERMESNFDKALGNDPSDTFDGKVTDVIQGNKFERKAYELREKAFELSERISINIALSQMARKWLWGTSYLNEYEINQLTRELTDIQEEARQTVIKDLNESGGVLKWPSHIKEKNIDKQFVQKELSDWAKILNVRSILIEEDQSYNYEDVLAHIPNIRRSIKMLDPNERKYLSLCNIILHPRNVNGVLSLNGFSDDISQPDIAIDYYKRPKDIADDLKNGIKDFSEKNQEYGSVYLNKLTEFEQSTGIRLTPLASQIYNFKEIVDKLPNIKKAIDSLTKDERKQLSQITLGLLDDRDENDFANTSGLTQWAMSTILLINYNNKPIKIAESIKSGLKKFMIAQPITQNPEPDYAEFFQDPALINIDSINIPNLPLATREGREFRVMIARNLYIQDLRATPENVLREYEEILKKRKIYRDIPVFSGRNVLCVAHNEFFSDNEGYSPQWVKNRERLTEGKHRFLTKATVDGLNKQNANFDIVRAGRSKELLKKNKKEIKDKLEQTKPPFTFLFAGHAFNEDLGLDKETYSLSVDEITNYIVQRYKNHHELQSAKPGQQDIFIFSACRTHNYIRNLYSALKKKLGNSNYTLPILYSASEYGQNGYSDILEDNKYANTIFSDVMNLGSGKSVTFGTLMDREHLHSSNPTLFIPTDNGKMMQISEIDKPESGKRAA